MIELSTLFISFIAGLISFVSPCILPLLPSIISFIGGVTVQDLEQSTTKKSRIILRTLSFVAGFAIVFIVVGLLVNTTFSVFGNFRSIIKLIGGGIIIIFGLNIIFDFWILLNIEKRFQVKKRPSGLISALLVGMAFGSGWSPCVGPIYTSIIFLASTNGRMLEGVIYLLAYSLGLGLPFILGSIFFAPFVKQLNKIKKYLPVIKIISGIFLILIGLLIMFGRFDFIVSDFSNLSYQLNKFSVEQPLASRLSFGLGFLLISLLFFIPSIIRLIKNPAQFKASNFFSIPKIILFVLFFIPAILQLLGVIDIAMVFSSWFSLATSPL
jgi:cytochrome c-type biogenesis protein